SGYGQGKVLQISVVRCRNYCRAAGLHKIEESACEVVRIVAMLNHFEADNQWEAAKTCGKIIIGAPDLETTIRVGRPRQLDPGLGGIYADGLNAKPCQHIDGGAIAAAEVKPAPGPPFSDFAMKDRPQVGIRPRWARIVIATISSRRAHHRSP